MGAETDYSMVLVNLDGHTDTYWGELGQVGTRVMLDNTKLPTGPLALLLTLLRPGNDKMLTASRKLTQHVWKQHSFFFVTASLVLLLWVGGVADDEAAVLLALPVLERLQRLDLHADGELAQGVKIEGGGGPCKTNHIIV